MDNLNENQSQTESSYNTTVNNNTKSDEVKETIVKYLMKVYGVLKKPISSGKELVVAVDIKTAFILIALQGILNSVFMMVVGKKYSSLMKSVLGIDSDTDKSIKAIADVPYLKYFFVTLIFTAGAACVLSLLLMAVMKIMQTPVSFLQMISLTSVRSAVLVPGILVSIVALVISWRFGIILFMLINVLGYSACVVTLFSVFSITEQEKKNMFVFMVSIAVMIFILIVSFAISRMWTLYIPKGVTDAINSLRNLSWEDIFGMFF